MRPLQWLFLDLNAYFASVEQQENPCLRGKPVAVVPMLADSTCCIAVSYEAKAFGIKTGTKVYEAKQRCPQIILVEGRHEIYTRYHHAIVDVVESCLPVTAVQSIDEMICRLRGSDQLEANARALGQHIKREITRRIGVCMRSSVGIAPNRFLAKLASDMQKPDGLTVIHQEDLPGCLYRLSLRDLPGIGARMEERLTRAGITTLQQLCALSPQGMHDLWGGVVGERFSAWLRGEETEETPNLRRSLGHSHVLEPERRTPAGALQIARKLTAKAAVRLRKIGYWAGGMSVFVKGRNRLEWERHVKLDEAQDTGTFLKTLVLLWREFPRSASPVQVGVVFAPLIAPGHHNLPLFENPRRERLSQAMDSINERHGKHTAYYASLSDTFDDAPTRIAFTRVPDLSEY